MTTMTVSLIDLHYAYVSTIWLYHKSLFSYPVIKKTGHIASIFINLSITLTQSFPWKHVLCSHNNILICDISKYSNSYTVQDTGPSLLGDCMIGSNIWLFSKKTPESDSLPLCYHSNCFLPQYNFLLASTKF